VLGARVLLGALLPSSGALLSAAVGVLAGADGVFGGAEAGAVTAAGVLTDDDVISTAATDPVIAPVHTYSAALRKKFRTSMKFMVRIEQVFGNI
jgi:hypothetical protein